MEQKYDSREDTLKHIARVKELLSGLCKDMLIRGEVHDASKLESPEKEVFDEVTPLLKTLTYGSQEYKDSLAKMGPALDHHYANNRHHPEFFVNGIEDMNLVDIGELLCDWKAASERHANGDIMKSIDINAARFNLSPQLVKILKNTAVYLFY